MSKAKKAAEARASAALFLLEVNRRAGLYADRLDPKLGRDYRDPLLKAVEGIAAKARDALFSIGADPHGDSDAEIIRIARNFKPGA